MVSSTTSPFASLESVLQGERSLKSPEAETGAWFRSSSAVGRTS